MVILVLPLSCSVEAPGATAQVTTVCVGASVSAGVVRHGALVNVLAPTQTLLEVEPWWTYALVAAQSVVAWGRAAHLTAGALILIYRGGEKQWGEETQRECLFRVSKALKVKGCILTVLTTWNEIATSESINVEAYFVCSRNYPAYLKTDPLH